MNVCPACGRRNLDTAAACEECAARLDPPGRPVADADRAALEAELLPLLRERRKIEAIRVHRERTGLGLKESKSAVDELAAREGIPAGGGCAGLLLVGALALAGLAGGATVLHFC